MRKIYSLLLMLVVAVTTAMAIDKLPQQEGLKPVAGKTATEIRDMLEQLKGARTMQGLAAEAEQSTVITSVPDAASDVQLMSMIGAGYTLDDEGYIEWTTGAGYLSSLHTTFSGETYLRNPMFLTPLGTYIKGVQTPFSMTFELPQDVLTLSNGSNVRLALSAIDRETKTFKMVEDQKLQLTPVGDGMWYWNNTNSYLLGYFDEEGEWWGMGLASLILREFNGSLPSVPEGLTSSTYKFVGGSGFDVTTEFLNVAMDGDKAYITGFSDYPDIVITGTMADGKLTLPSGQFAGLQGTSQLVYFQGGTATTDEYDNTEVTAVDELVLTYNEETKTFESASTGFILRGDVEYGDPLLYLESVSMSQFVNVAATPADPIISYAYPYEYDEEAEMAYAGINFYMPKKDVDGNELNTTLLSYRIYVNNDETKPYAFSPEAYTTLDSETSQFPYGFTEEQFFYFDGDYHGIVIFHEVSRIGVQSVYTVNGEERTSSIVWNRNEWETGIEAVNAEQEVAGVTYYNANGQQIARPGKGITVVAKRMADGKVVTTKVLNK